MTDANVSLNQPDNSSQAPPAKRKSGGSRRGVPNRRTVLRQARLAAEGKITVDSMAIIQEAAAYFLGLAHEEKRGGKDTKARRARVRQNYYDAAIMAEKILPFRHPRLSTVKVSGDPKNPLNGQSREQLMAGILADLARFGITAEHLRLAGQQDAPPMIDVTPEEQSEGVANR